MNKERDEYIKNIGSSYRQDTINMAQQDSQNDYWYEVGTTVPHVTVGAIIGSIIGFSLVMYFLAWPLFKAFFGPAFGF